MKRCPQCNRVETDEALRFCRVDGATLVSDSSSFSGEAGTAQLGSQPDLNEVHTSIFPKRPGRTSIAQLPVRRGVLACALARAGRRSDVQHIVDELILASKTGRTRPDRRGFVVDGY